jgi:uncharacterized protein (TIGR02996 family)
MSDLDGILSSIADDPLDTTNRLVLADWLEDHDQPQRAELTRLTAALITMKQTKKRWPIEERVRDLLLAKVEPCLPRRVSSCCQMVFTLIPPGTFKMGSLGREAGRMNDEQSHSVKITKGFWLGIYPVTQGEYRTLMGKNPSFFNSRKKICKGLEADRLPVEMVSWDDTQKFLAELNKRDADQIQGWRYRLPTEAEWEYACRGGMSNRWPFHFGSEITTEIANFESFDGPNLDRTSVVGSYPPNAFGLYDMHGNVDEWVNDWCDYEYYPRSPAEDPPGAEIGTSKMIRGGSWRGEEDDCRAAVRIGERVERKEENIGFRVALVRA